MLLVVDVGNTHITLGVFDGKELKATFRMTAKQPRTSDEYGEQLTGMLSAQNVSVGDITGGILSSVVPSLDYTLEKMCALY